VNSLKHYGRLVGIDVGTKRVGVARTDLLRTVANPVGTFPPDEVLNVIAGFQDSHPVVGFVVGWPLTTSGEKGKATEMVEDFIKKLEKRFPGISIHRVDERYSSQEAMNTLINAGVSQKRRGKKGRVDQTAAALLLQHFLESNSNHEDS